jgi:hypothetical protein
LSLFFRMFVAGARIVLYIAHIYIAHNDYIA